MPGAKDREFKEVTDGFDLALNGKVRQDPPTSPKLVGDGEAKLTAMRLGKPPIGFGKWTLQLLADRLVKLEVVASISPETVRQTPLLEFANTAK